MPYVRAAPPYPPQLLCIIHIARTGRNTAWIWLTIFLAYGGSLAYLNVGVLPSLGRGGCRGCARRSGSEPGNSALPAPHGAGRRLTGFSYTR